MRARTRLAVSVLPIQNGDRIFRMSSVVMASTRLDPITGWAYLALVQSFRCAWTERSAQAVKVGAAGLIPGAGPGHH